MMARRRTTGSGTSIDGRPSHPQYLDEDDESLIDDPVPVNDFSELDDEEDSNPSDRRRDPLRRKF